MPDRHATPTDLRRLSLSLSISLSLSLSRARDRPTERPIDRPTDRPTDMLLRLLRVVQGGAKWPASTGCERAQVTDHHRGWTCRDHDTRGHGPSDRITDASVTVRVVKISLVEAAESGAEPMTRRRGLKFNGCRLRPTTAGRRPRCQAGRAVNGVFE
jgi:hypothetical protein